MPEHKSARVYVRKLFKAITEVKTAQFIVLSFVSLVALTFVILMILGVWTPKKAVNAWKNQRIVNATDDLANKLLISRTKFNGVPSNSQLKMAISNFNVLACTGGLDNTRVLRCEGLYPGVAMPNVCLDSKTDINPDCFITIFSDADISNGELGAGRFRILARLFPTMADVTGVVDQTYYVYDSKEEGFYCSGYSKYDSRDSMSKYESCRSARR